MAVQVRVCKLSFNFRALSDNFNLLTVQKYVFFWFCKGHYVMARKTKFPFLLNDVMVDFADKSWFLRLYILTC